MTLPAEAVDAGLRLSDLLAELEEQCVTGDPVLCAYAEPLIGLHWHHEPQRVTGVRFDPAAGSLILQRETSGAEFEAAVILEMRQDEFE